MFRSFISFLLLIGLLITQVYAGDTLWQGYYNFENIKQENDNGSFDLHHLSTFMQHNWKDFTLFAEIEYERSPKIDSTNNNATDRGAILVETSWLNINFSELFQLRMGRLLNPGWWQTYHYPNIVLTIQRPQIIRTVFPASQTASMFHGKSPFESFTLGYQAWLGNGGFTTSGHQTSNSEYSKGVRFSIADFSFMDYSDVGLMYDSHPSATGKMNNLVGVDFVVEKAGVGLNTAWHRNTTSGLGGWYAIPSYRIPLKGLHAITPYFLYDSITQNDRTSIYLNPGIRYNYTPKVSIKFESTNKESAGVKDRGFATQFAYFFN